MRDADYHEDTVAPPQVIGSDMAEPDVRSPAIDGFADAFCVAQCLPPGIDFDAPVPEGVKERGTLGCVLSHARCWHTVAEGDAPVLILEDDAALTDHAARMTRDIAALGQFDLVFVNRRMRRYRRNLDALEPRDTFLRLDDFHKEMSQNFAPKDFTTRWKNPEGKLVGPPGGEGYVLSPAGARKLLKAFAEFQPLVHADWLLYTMGLDPATLEAYPGCPAFARFLSKKTLTRAPLRDTYNYSRPVVDHASGRVGGSVRGGTPANN